MRKTKIKPRGSLFVTFAILKKKKPLGITFSYSFDIRDDWLHESIVTDKKLNIFSCELLWQRVTERFF